MGHGLIESTFDKTEGRASSINMQANGWDELYDARSDKYSCFVCGKQAQHSVSKTEKNPGREFVSCNKQRGGCGWFNWMDEQPKAGGFGGGGAATKRQRVTVDQGASAAMPTSDAVDMGRVITQLSDVTARLVTLQETVDRMVQILDSPPVKRKGRGDSK